MLRLLPLFLQKTLPDREQSLIQLQQDPIAGSNFLYPTGRDRRKESSLRCEYCTHLCLQNAQRRNRLERFTNLGMGAKKPHWLCHRLELPYPVVADKAKPPDVMAIVSP